MTKDGEQEVAEAFGKAIALRAEVKEARELADRWFFETVVRVQYVSAMLGFQVWARRVRRA